MGFPNALRLRGPNNVGELLNVKLISTDISVTVVQIKTFHKTRCIFFSNFASGRTISTQSTGPQPIQLVPKHCFYSDISVSVPQIKKFKKQSPLFFFNFASGRTL